MALDLEVMRYEKGDEEAIATLLTDSFNTFASFGMDGEKWLNYQQIDPGFDLNGAFVAKFEEKITGHVQLVYRNLKIGESTFISVAGIGNVCVLPEYRHSGIATTILNQVHTYIKEMDLSLAALLVQYESNAWLLYKKLGYHDVYHIEDVICELEELKQMTKMSEGSDNITIRKYVKGDEKKLLEVYNSSMVALAGIQRRDIAYWKKRYIAVLTYDGFFYESFNPDNILIAEEDNTICGYCVLNTFGEKGYIREFFVSPGREDVVNPLITAAIERLCSIGAKEMVFLNSLGTLYETFRNIAECGNVKISPHDQFMVKIMDFSTLMRAMEHTILEKVKDVQPISLLFKVGEKQISVVIEVDKIIFKERFKKYNMCFMLDEESFLKLLFGAISTDELMESGKIVISPNNEQNRKILRLIFPKKTFHICIGDVW